MAGGWRNSNRRNELPDNWPTLRQQVLARDNHRCVWRIMTGAMCGDVATDVDHIVRGSNHDLSNLRSLCGYHHSRKTAQEGNQARKRASQCRPKSRHPGFI